jgi:hypothetical protein
VGGRVLPIALAAIAGVATAGGCSRSKAGHGAPADETATESRRAAGQGAEVRIQHVSPGETPVPLVPSVADAAPAVDAEPIRASDVLSGRQAEQVIGESVGPAAADGGAGEIADLTITPTGVGPFRLGQTRRELLARMGRRAKVTRVDTDPSQPSVEYIDYRGDEGVRLLRVKLYAARAIEIIVYSSTRHAATDGDVAVGATFDDAVMTHGPLRRVAGGAGGKARGWVAQDLPGVVLVPEDPALLSSSDPAPTAKIGAIVVLGTESE